MHSLHTLIPIGLLHRVRWAPLALTELNYNNNTKKIYGTMGVVNSFVCRGRFGAKVKGKKAFLAGGPKWIQNRHIL